MFGLIANSPRPNRYDSDVDVEGRDYAINFSRYAIGAAFNQQHTDFINQYYTNLNFHFDNQWIDNQDLEHFLKTVSNQSKNRIKVVQNKIYPIVSQFIGNAIAMDITVRASALSSKAITRREDKLQELYLFQDIAANAPPQIGEDIKDKFGLGKDKKETESLFNNLWQDNYIKVINALMEDNANKNDFTYLRGELGINMALSGLAVMMYQEWNGDMVWESVPVDTFFFDHSARKQDLSDAGFMGTYPKMLPSEIFEKWDVKDEDKKAIEKAITTSTNAPTEISFVSDGKIPIYKTYWKDSISSTYGYVKDEFDYICFMELNKKEEGQDKPQYTDKDLIPYSELNETQRRLCNGNSKTKNNKTTKWVDVIRYCEMIPRELVTGKTTNTQGDIVLAFGRMPYQDTEYYKFASTRFPLKCHCWNYSHGTIITPISMLINPQRMINRFGSVAENLVNCSMPSVPAYDKSMLDPQGGEAQLLSDWYQGKPLALDARQTGINNAITRVGSTLDTNSLKTYAELQDSMHKSMWDTTGVNESILGQSQGSEQLVGVTALQIQRGSIIQEPFYSALANIFEQAYRAIANVGKRIYADNEKELACAVGDDGVEILKVTKEITTEDFRISIHREPSGVQQKQLANQTLEKYYQLQLINKQTFANLYNRSFPDDVAAAIRADAKTDILVAQKTQEAQAQAQQAQQQQEQGDKQAELQKTIDDRNATLQGNQMRKDGLIDSTKINAATKLQIAANKGQGK